MTIAQLTFVGLSTALAAAPALSQPVPLTPVSMGPAASGQCVVGSERCGAARGTAMDPVAENALVGLGQRAVPTLGTAAEKKVPPPAARIPDVADAAESMTDLAALGGQIINPLGAAAPFRGAIGQNPTAATPARLAVLDAPGEAAGITAAQVAAPSGLSYTQSQTVEAALGQKGTALGTLSGAGGAPGDSR